MADPAIRALQAAARSAAREHIPGCVASKVVVYDEHGKAILGLAIPNIPLDDAGETALDMPAVTPTARPGWAISDRVAKYDGKVVIIGPSRLKLLRVLLDAETGLSAKELATLAFDREADEENARYHIKTLRAELRSAFPDFEGEPIPNDGGYRLILR